MPSCPVVDPVHLVLGLALLVGLGPVHPVLGQSKATHNRLGCSTENQVSMQGKAHTLLSLLPASHSTEEL